MRGDVRGVTRRRRLRPSSDRDCRGARGRARRSAVAARRGVPAAPLHAAPAICSTTSVRRWPRRRRRADRHLRRPAKRRFRASRSMRSPTRCAARRRAARRAGGSRTCRRRSARLARPGDLVVTLGAGSIGTVERSDSSTALGAEEVAAMSRVAPHVAACRRPPPASPRPPTGGSGGPTSVPGTRRRLGLLRLARGQDRARRSRSLSAAGMWLPRARCSTSSLLAVKHDRRARQRHGCRRARCEALLDGIRGENILQRGLRGVSPPRAGLAVGRRRRALARAAVDVERARRRAHADGHRAARPAAVPRGRRRRDHRRVRRRSTASSICRSSTVWFARRQRDGPLVDADRVRLTGRVPRRARRPAGSADAAVAGGRVERARRRRDARRRPGVAAPRRRPVRRAADDVSRARADADASGFVERRLRRSAVRRAGVRPSARRAAGGGEAMNCARR